MMRACPRCTFPLDVVAHDDTTLDHCRRCGGTFLDPGEETQIFGAVVSPSIWEQSSAREMIYRFGLGPGRWGSLQAETEQALRAADLHGEIGTAFRTKPLCHCQVSSAARIRRSS